MYPTARGRRSRRHRRSGLNCLNCRVTHRHGGYREPLNGIPAAANGGGEGGWGGRLVPRGCGLGSSAVPETFDSRDYGAPHRERGKAQGVIDHCAFAVENHRRPRVEPEGGPARITLGDEIDPGPVHPVRQCLGGLGPQSDLYPRRVQVVEGEGDVDAMGGAQHAAHGRRAPGRLVEIGAAVGAGSRAHTSASVGTRNIRSVIAWPRMSAAVLPGRESR